MTEPIGPEKWVVENFDFISSGLVGKASTNQYATCSQILKGHDHGLLSGTFSTILKWIKIILKNVKCVHTQGPDPSSPLVQPSMQRPDPPSPPGCVRTMYTFPYAISLLFIARFCSYFVCRAIIHSYLLSSVRRLCSSLTCASSWALRLCSSLRLFVSSTVSSSAFSSSSPKQAWWDKKQ